MIAPLVPLAIRGAIWYQGETNVLQKNGLAYFDKMKDLIEGWRGEILCFVRFAAEGRIARYFPRDPSWLTWPALERLIHGNIVPDFPVCNKSVNASYSAHDL